MEMRTKKGIIQNIVDSIVVGAIGLLVLAGVMVGVTAFKIDERLSFYAGGYTGSRKCSS